MGLVPPVPARAAAALALLLGVWLLAGPLRAGEARLVEGTAADRIVVEASDASTDEVLAMLARHFEFAVERSTPASQPVRFSGRLQGSLDEVLERLLRHEGHMIVRSAEARAGIARVLFLEGKAGAPLAPALAGPIAAIKARMQLQEQKETGQ
jgi:hypothetical protein